MTQRYLGTGIYGLQPPLWVSGAANQPADDWVTSPADKEVYQRIAATNSSTTDPADDTTNYVARSYERTVAIAAPTLINASTSPTASPFFRNVTSSSLAAYGTTRTRLLNITGRGVIDFLGFWKGATGNTRYEVLVDGRSVYDATLNTAAAQEIAYFIGSPVVDNSGYFGRTVYKDPTPIVFKRSFEFWITNASGSDTSTSSFIGRSVRSTG